MIARELTERRPKRLTIRAADGETSDAKNGLLYHCSSFALFLPSFTPCLFSHAVDGESQAPSSRLFATSPAIPSRARQPPAGFFLACGYPARDAQKNATAAKPGYREP